MKRIVLLAILALVSIVLPSCTEADIQTVGSALGAFAGGFVPVSYSEMQDMSLCISAKIAGMYDIYNDPALLKYVNMIAMTVGHYSDRPDFSYRVQLLNAPNEVNAFTTADGRIFVTTGLLAAVQDESELAGVLGHEIAHAARGHVAKAVANERKKAGMVKAGGLVAQQYAPQYAQILTSVADATFDAIALRPRDRAQESEADTYGMYYAEAAGYSPKGLLNFLSRLRNEEQSGGSAMTKIFDTHPDINQRVTDVGNSIAQNFHPRENSPIMVQGATGKPIERAQYFTASLK